MKKKLLACAAILFAAITANAQMEKGTVLIGGNLSVGTTKVTLNSSETKSTTFGIAPSIGWAYSTNKFFGFSLSYAHLKQTEDYKENTFGAGIFMRQYMPVAKNLYLFAHEGLSYSTTKGDGMLKTVGYDIDANKWNATLGLSPGISYELNKKIQLEVLLNNLVSVGYSHSKSTYTAPSSTSKSESESNSFNFNSNADPTQLTSISVGVRFTLGRNKS